MSYWGTPLVAAVVAGSLEVVKYLVQVGADPNMQVVVDGCHVSALSSAVRDGRQEIIEYLLPLITDPEEIEYARQYYLKYQ